MQNLANQTTDLKHAAPIREIASGAAARARSIETDEQSALTNALAATHIAAAQLSGRQRGREPDADGYKLSHIPTNDFRKFSSQMKAIYKARDGVETAEQFKAIALRACLNCPKDAPNMPHREGVCTIAFGTTEDAKTKLGKVRAARAQQRIASNYDRMLEGQPATTFSAMLAAALVMDESRVDDGGHEQACMHIAAMSPIEVHDDTNVDTFINAVELFCQVCKLSTSE